ncbi:DUF1178 family protein [Aestuariivirga sp. YIM B02566]|uniref:DUF1178 family protein n=1 Tax=Taklimakanibacter albus TaxID=2800327 RepID=A0ACC5R658_9HYPH|nr:DUF1178 family protein [Aestuariivirga sp. YIM B02566]MBK1868145.1 DUF1178 family protein [Aestuariivirga sp. YIM B02566]
MIRYDLICDKGHEFDGWFSDSAAYDAQAKRGLVTCVHCGSAKIEKQLMAPGIPVKGNRKKEGPTRPAASASAAQPVLASAFDPRQEKLLQMMREMRKAVEENAEYVGNRFAEEARKIHYEESDKRGIYGETTAQDAKELIEEGIDIHPLPVLPEDGN